MALRIPLATYRLQFNRSFTFADAARLISYLHALGISDCYASPYFKARPGSSHGYDVIDHNSLNPEVGGERDYNAFIEELQHHGMGQILDMVPNHMAISGSVNALWADVLENGPSSLYAPVFDIDWTPVKADLADKVLLPILGEQYGRVLENQELTVQYEDGGFVISYFDHRFPIAPRPATTILSHRLGDLERALGVNHPHLLELRSIITALNHLPLRTETDREKVIERSREKEIIKKRLAMLTTTCPEVATFVAENVRFFNGTAGERRSFDPLDNLLADQAYRLAYWRVAADEINYRRFFDINELAAVRTEEPAVFAMIHQLLLRLLAEGKVTGLRIDNVDGLYDPAAYLQRLQQAAALALRFGTYPEVHSLIARTDQLAPPRPLESTPLPLDLPCYVVVEKILGPGEQLPEEWPIHGTTGYDFLVALNGLFVDQTNAHSFTDLYSRFKRTRPNSPELMYDSKKLIMLVSLPSEMNMLAHQLDRLSERNRHSQDFTLNSLTHALREIIACFPVYRTYINGHGVTSRDRDTIELAVARAKHKNPATDASIFHYVRDVLLLGFPDSVSAADREAQRAFVLKFQQYTGPVMAKGVEDTAFYRYNRLVSLNEVGGTPEQFGTSLAAFHEQNQERAQRWPYGLLATTTHDSKRSEDVRARLNVLSEIPDEWQAALRRWSKLNKKKKPLVDGQRVPDRNEEYLLYQTLLGAWPLTLLAGEDSTMFKRRIQDYMHKATKEAKVNTSWINPHQAYDDAVQEFVSAVIDHFAELEDFHDFRRKVAHYGMYNSLSQTLLKLTAPGVPDIYQGNEIWDFSLADPDNRRPVDYDLRCRMLNALQQQICAAEPNLVALARELCETWEDGRIKLYVTYRTLSYRQEHPNLFSTGSYIPLECVGPGHTHICAFARQYEQQVILVIVPRFLTRLSVDPRTPPLGPQVWKDSWLMLPGGSAGRCYRNLFTRESETAANRESGIMLALARVLADFPVALLEEETG